MAPPARSTAEHSVPVTATASGRTATNDELLPQVRIIVGMITASADRHKLYLLGAALCVIIGSTAFAQIRLNAWNQPFYDALSRKDLVAFYHQLIVFVVIASGLLILNVAQAWLNQTAKMKLRDRLTRDLFDQWLGSKRAFRLAGAGEIGSNPDQRIHEDARHLAELATDLGIGLFQSTLLLLSFIGVLWVLSEGIVITAFGRSFSIPGYMVWCALLYAGTASLLSWRVGRPLVSLNAERYAREADLRFALVWANEHADGIAIYGGERDENRRLHRELDHVLHIMRRLVTGVTRLTWVTAGYGWFAIVAPIIVAAPGYFAGDISFGGLMMVVGAFNQVQQALRWFVDNYSTIADWRATLHRVAQFRSALGEVDKLGEETGKIERLVSTDNTLVLDNIGIASPAGSTRLSEARVVVRPGSRILIVGKRGVGKTNFLRAIAGLWLWGCGRLALPPVETMMFISRLPYIPPGTLRDALAYPLPASKFQDSDFIAALGRMRLAHLATELDRIGRWDRELSGDEQQNLTFARLLLHKPRFVVIDEALDILDEESRSAVLDIFRKELADTAVVYIGRPGARDGFFTRVLHLFNDPEGLRLSPATFSWSPAAQAAGT